MIDEKVLNIIEQARTMAITILVCDGHDIDGFYVKDTNLIAHHVILALSELNYNVDEQNFKDLCSSNFESIYRTKFITNTPTKIFDLVGDKLVIFF